jgi:hypothetical protein
MWYSQREAPLGNGHIAVKLDYLLFTDNLLNQLGENDGLYAGLEGYRKIAPNFYLGGEVGQGANVSIFGEDIFFVPLELNTKYALEASPDFVVDFGAGVSYNYIRLYDINLFSESVERNDWLFGGQFFADLAYKFKRYSAGVHAK